MIRSSILILLLWSTAASAADLDAPFMRRDDVYAAPSGRAVTVLVDQLFLGSNGCPRRRDCIAPRVLPVEHSRGVGYVAVPIPVDPRSRAYP